MERKTYLGLFALTIVGLLGVSGLAAAHGGFGFTQTLSDEDLEEIRAQHDAMQQTIENSDFNAWKSLQEERLAQMQSELTEENFYALVERHQKMEDFHEAMQQAKETGDFSEVEFLREEMGNEFGFNQGFGHHGMMGPMPFSE